MNPYSHAPSVVGALFILLAIGSFYSRNTIFTGFSFLSLCSGLWQLSWAFLFNVDSFYLASIIAKVGHLPIITLPIAIILVAKNYYSSQAKIILVPHLIFLITLSTLLFFTNSVINDVNQYYFGYYPRAGSLHFIFILYASYATFELLRIFKHRQKRRSEFKIADYIFLSGLLIYPLSSIDFLVNYNFEFYPFGFVFLIFFIACTFSAILLSLNTELSILNAELEIRIEEATEKINRQQGEIIQTSKLASIGVMAAGVAHELNNPINFLKPTIQKLIVVCEGLISVRGILLQNSPMNPQALEIEKQIKLDKFLNDKAFIFETCTSLINKIQAISSGLNTFTRETSKADKQKESVLKIIKSTVSLIPSDILVSKKIQIFTEVTSDFSLICNANQISQVILNLVKNAIDAIECNGIVNIKISTDNTVGIVEIQDNGPGISDDHLLKIFDPFFTTKDPGKGTGLGLSISREIVNAHSGELKVDSQTGRGTKFSIIFRI